MQKRRWFGGLGALLIFCCLAVGCGSSTAAPELPPIGLQAGSVTGELIAYDDLRDTDTVLWFWAPW